MAGHKPFENEAGEGVGEGEDYESPKNTDQLFGFAFAFSIHGGDGPPCTCKREKNYYP